MRFSIIIFSAKEAYICQILKNSKRFNRKELNDKSLDEIEDIADKTREDQDYITITDDPIIFLDNVVYAASTDIELLIIRKKE